MNSGDLFSLNKIGTCTFTNNFIVYIVSPFFIAIVWGSLSSYSACVEIDLMDSGVLWFSIIFGHTCTSVTENCTVYHPCFFHIPFIT